MFSVYMIILNFKSFFHEVLQMISHMHIADLVWNIKLQVINRSRKVSNSKYAGKIILENMRMTKKDILQDQTTKGLI